MPPNSAITAASPGTVVLLHAHPDDEAIFTGITMRRLVDEGHRVVAVVAQLIPRKGHALLLEAWQMIRYRCPDARLLVFGAGPLREELEARVGPGAANEGGTVTFAGFRPDLRAFLGRVDLLVHPASREGLGIGLLEAQAAGVPVVACAAGGVPEAVADGDTGLLVEPGNPLALAEGVIKLLDDPNWRLQLGTAAAARIRAQFSPDRMTEAYIELYREVLA